MSAATFLFNQMFAQPYMINSNYHQLQYGQLFGTYPNQKPIQQQEIEAKAVNTNYKQEVIEWQILLYCLCKIQRFDNITFLFVVIILGLKQTTLLQYRLVLHMLAQSHSLQRCSIMTIQINLQNIHYSKNHQSNLKVSFISLSRFPSISQELERKCFKYPLKEEERDTLSYKSQQKLLASIKIFDNEQLFDSMLIEDTIENIISICEDSSDGNAFQSQPKVNYNQQQKQYQTSDSLWFVPATQQTCAYWIVNEIEKAVAIMYKNLKQNDLQKNSELQKSKTQQQFLQLTEFWNAMEKGQKTQIINKAINFQKNLKLSFKKNSPYSSYRTQKSQDKDSQWMNSFDIETKWILSFLQYENKMENLLFSDIQFTQQASIIDRCIYVTLDQTMQSQTYALKNVLKDINIMSQEKMIQDLIKNEQIIKKKPKNKKKNKQKKKDREDYQLLLEPSNESNGEGLLETHLTLISVQSQDGSDSLSVGSQSQDNRRTQISTFTPPISESNDQSRNSMNHSIGQISHFSFNDSQQDTHDEYVQVQPLKKSHRKNKLKNSKKQKDQPEENEKCTDSSTQIKEAFPKKTMKLREISPSAFLKQPSLIKIDSDDSPVQQLVKLQQLDEFDVEILGQSHQKIQDRLGKDLIQFTQSLLCDCDKLLKIRKLVFNRIQFVVKHVFSEFDADVRLYGSQATGMALPDSDIDIGVIGLEMMQNNQQNQPIYMLLAVLGEMKWVQSLIPIFTSHVPVLKFEVNPFISMESSTKNLPAYFQQIICQSDLFYLNCQMQCPLEKITFQIDVTINQFQSDPMDYTFNNLGQLSTEMVLQWSKDYKELQCLVLFFKMMLKRRGLNQQYNGGLSSFCTIIIVVSFIEYQYQKDPTVSLGEMFFLMLDFYGNKFDPQLQGISYQGFGQKYHQFQYILSPFFSQTFEHLIPVQILSPFSSQIISSSCSFIQIILQDIKCMHQAAIEETLKIYQRLSKKKRIRKPCKEPNFVFVELEKLSPLFSTCLQ